MNINGNDGYRPQDKKIDYSDNTPEESASVTDGSGKQVRKTHATDLSTGQNFQQHTEADCFTL